MITNQPRTGQKLWRQSILSQLNERKKIETHPFADVFKYYAKLLDEKKSSSYRSSAPGSSENVHSPEHAPPSAHHEAEKRALENKVFQLQEELTAVLKKKDESSTKLLQLKSELEEKDKDMDQLLKQLNSVKMELHDAKEKIKHLEHRVQELADEKQFIKDEHDTLQTAFDCLDKKHLDLLRDYDELSRNFIDLKNRQAAAEDERLKNVRAQARLQQNDLLLSAMENPNCPPASNAPNSYVSGIICAMCKVPQRSLFTIEAHESEVNALKWTSKGDILATGGGDRKVKLWQMTATGATLKATLTGSNAAITSIDIDSDSLVASCNDFAARIWALDGSAGCVEYKLRRTLTGHANKVFGVKFMPSTNKIVTGSHDRTLKLWDIHRMACYKTLFAGSSCNDLVVCTGSPISSTIISGHIDKKIRFWDTRAETTPNEVVLGGKITSLDISANGFTLLACVRDDTLKTIDLRMNQIIKTYCSDGFRVAFDYARAKFSPDGDNEYIACGSSDGSVFVWNTLSGRVEKILRDEHRSSVIATTWDPKGQIFVSCDRQKKVVLWTD